MAVIEDSCTSNSDIIDPDENQTKPRKSFTNIFLLVCAAGVTLGILLEVVNVIKRNHSHSSDRVLCTKKPTYWVYPNTPEVNNKIGFLKHVHLVLERLGYEKSTSETPWSLLWSYPPPFSQINLRNLSDNQLVNFFPGSEHVCSKVELSTTDSRYIPKAFGLPHGKNEFLKYAEENENALFLQKDNTHRGVYLKNLSDIDLDNGNTFVQEYIQNPYLVDGHKFDIGVYVVLKSVNPLRIYWYKGDVQFRYCLEKYYPFDPANLDKYVLGNDYLPTWKMPSLKRSYITQGNTMKEAFDIYVRSKGKDPTDMWLDVEVAIAEVFIMKEHLIIDKLKEFSSSKNFFELMRFDLMIDEDLNVYLLEANMGPNMNSRRYPANQLLFEQVLYNMFSLTGVARATVMPVDVEDSRDTRNMISSQKNIAVFGDECTTACKDNCEALDLCYLCKPCIAAELRRGLLTAHAEFLHRGDFRRIIPPPMVPNKDIKSLEEDIKHLSPSNKLLHLWYQGKCNQDLAWCM